ncbi:MAG: ferritin-like domain-containing protein [Deltaproteobacteria bacterium]|nr:ferritin-like domain-containing protein [Deltaproteobacteria bacterium]
MSDDFSIETPTQEPGIGTAMQVVYQWNYEPQVEELRRLYVKATEAQWIAEREIDWDQPIDRTRFATTPLGTAVPVEQCSYWKSLDPDTTWELTRRTAAFRLSNFLHGEQGALMVAAQLVNAVPHTDAKFYAATQTMDEARHVEVFARYIKKLDEVQTIAPPLKSVLDTTLQTDDWLKKLVGMQIVVEGLALYSFREMRNLTEEPLLKELLTYVARDESRHHAYGVQYVERCVPLLGEREKRELEDFALEAARTLIDSRNQQTLASAVMKIWAEVGIDPVELFNSVAREREELTRHQQLKGRRLGPVQGFVIPTLRRCGLLSERVATHFHEFLRENLGGALVGEDVQDFLAHIPELPRDTAAWVLGAQGN